MGCIGPELDVGIPPWFMGLGADIMLGPPIGPCIGPGLGPCNDELGLGAGMGLPCIGLGDGPGCCMGPPDCPLPILPIISDI